MRDPNISWVSMVEKKLGLEMDDSDDDESSDDGIGLALKIMTRHDVINMFSRFSVIVTFIGNLLFLGKKNRVCEFVTFFGTMPIFKPVKSKEWFRR